MTPRRLHIWHLCANRWNSAIAEYALSAAQALALGGHETLFIAQAEAPVLQRALKVLPTLAVADFTVRGLAQLQARLRRSAPDLVLAYGGAETALAGLLRLITPFKLIRFQGQVLTPRLLQAPRHRFAHRAVDLVLTPSEALAGAVRALRPRQPVVAVPLGCDNERYRQVPSAASVEARPALVVFGRLDPVKGHQVMLEHLARLLKSWDLPLPPPYLHIVGLEANLSVASLEQAAAACGLQVGSDVVFTPERIADVAALLSAATLGVVPSLGSEIICRVAEEFLLCGTPVAVSGVGSLAEVLFPGAGFSYAGFSEEETAAAFRHWIAFSAKESPAAKARRAQQARLLYSLEAMANALTHAIGEL